MAWSPLSEAELWDKINAAELRMTPEITRFWEAVRVEPQKWAQTPYGDAGGGFWVVAIVGQRAIWYNDIEDGFNCSRYSEFRRITEYWCNQDELELTLARVLESVRTGRPIAGHAGPPIEGEFGGA